MTRARTGRRLGPVALTLALAITVGSRNTGRIITFLALFWMTGGLITLRFALAIRPRPGFRLGLAAAIPIARASKSEGTG